MSGEFLAPQISFLQQGSAGNNLVEFPYTAHCGRIEFSLKNVSKIEKENIFTAKTIFDASYTPRNLEETFSLPIDTASYKIYTKQNGAYDLRIAVSEKIDGDKSTTAQKLKPWLWASGVHALLAIAAFIAFSNFAWMENPAGAGDTAAATEDAATPTGNSEVIPKSDRKPYSGFSLWQLLASRRPKPSKEERIASLLENELSGKSLTPGSRGGDGSSKGSLINFNIGRKAVDVGSLANAAGLNQRAAVSTLSAAERNKAEAELKNRMDQAQKQLRSYYGQALRKDPSFNTRVIVTARISNAGRLENLQATPQGHSQQQAALASELSSSIKTFLLKLPVPSVLAGHTIRREFIFWK
jgi:hypothetical protein